MESVPTLIIVPVRAERAEDIEPILQTLVSLRATAPEAMVLVVDDRSPAQHAQMIEVAADELDCAYVLQQDGEGRSAAFNVGLSAAAEHGMDACLVASGLVLDRPAGSTACAPAPAPTATPAAVAGGAVIEPTGLIRQAGYFFSLFRRDLERAPRPRPGGAARRPRRRCCARSAPSCSSSAASGSSTVGLYDELLDGPHAALDYCLRVSEAGGQCVLRADACAPARSSSSTASPTTPTPAARRLRVKHAGVSFQQWAPEVI